jgi:hypothetical protein
MNEALCHHPTDPADIEAIVHRLDRAWLRERGAQLPVRRPRLLVRPIAPQPDSSGVHIGA